MIADNSTNLAALYKVLFEDEKLELSEECVQKVEESFNFLQSFSNDKIIYGINTGFGPMAQYRIEDQSLIDLQYNIIRSHSTGAGKPLPKLYVKAAMIARLYTFLQGKSGVHKELVLLLCEFINRGIYPFIPEHGSVGASGDLVQLAHIALTLIGEGEVFYQGQLCDTATVLQENELKPFSMHIREGLSVTNGTSVMTGIGIVNLIYAQKLLHWSVVASVMMNEIAASFDKTPTMDERVSEICNAQSIGAAIENMTLTATELGLGSLWICDTFFAQKELSEWLNGELYAALAIGYAAENPCARPRKKTENAIEWRE